MGRVTLLACLIAGIASAGIAQAAVELFTIEDFNTLLEKTVASEDTAMTTSLPCVDQSNEYLARVARLALRHLPGDGAKAQSAQPTESIAAIQVTSRTTDTARQTAEGLGLIPTDNRGGDETLFLISRSESKATDTIELDLVSTDQEFMQIASIFP